MKKRPTMEEILQMLEECKRAIGEYIDGDADYQNDISEKIAVYSMTKNCYDFAVASMKSLLINSNVDKIYLIGDGGFPKDLPDVIVPMEVDTKKYISPISPNNESRYTHYCLIRLAFYDIFKQYDQILSMDYDTIVDKDISPIFDINLGDKYYIGGVKETYRSVRKILGYYSGATFQQMNGGYTEPDLYVNAGVLLMNLRKIREDGLGKASLEEVNRTYYLLPEQDILNILANGKVYLLPDKYNSQKFTPQSFEPCVYHFLGDSKKAENPIVEKYSKISWDQVMKHRKVVYGK